MASQHATIDILLRLVPDSPAAVLNHLVNNPSLASQQDASGYSLLHAAASYSQLDLMKALVQEYNIPVDLRDVDDETPLFAAETVAAARFLVEELGADVHAENEEGVTAQENASANIDDGGEWVLVADYLATASGATGAESTSTSAADENTDQRMNRPPPLPEGVRITGMQQVPEPEDQPPADPEFRRRIEELAGRDDFQGEQGQRELQQLVADAVGGLARDQGDGRDVRRRID